MLQSRPAPFHALNRFGRGLSRFLSRAQSVGVLLLLLASTALNAEQRFGITRSYTEGEFAAPALYNTDADQRFGGVAVVGDFDGDGVLDTAVSSPNENTACCFGAGGPGEGRVYIAYDFANVAARGESADWTQRIGLFDVSGIISQHDAHFGQSLYAMDANLDGFDDLIIGAPDFDVSFGGSTRADAGAIFVVWGSETGLDAANADYYTRASFDAGEPMAGDRFGFAITGLEFAICSITEAPDYFYSTLLVGIPFADVEAEADAGLPHVAMADQAICLGPALARQSYLDTDRLLAAAAETMSSAPLRRFWLR